VCARKKLLSAEGAPPCLSTILIWHNDTPPPPRKVLVQKKKKRTEIVKMVKKWIDEEKEKKDKLSFLWLLHSYLLRAASLILIAQKYCFAISFAITVNTPICLTNEILSLETTVYMHETK
jgi:hypothetical protein